MTALSMWYYLTLPYLICAERGIDGCWRCHLEKLNVIQCWNTAKDAILKAEDKCVPKKRQRISSRLLCMQQNVMQNIQKKRHLWETYRKSRDYEEYQAYQRVEKRG